MAQPPVPTEFAVYSGLFPYTPSRAQKRMIQIVEGAIKNYARRGIENTTYDSIAKTCKISRPLIQHYFKDQKALFEMTVKFIRVKFQQLAIDAIKGSPPDPVKQLENYVDSCFEWIEKAPLHWRVWKLMYYYCGVDPNLKDLNTELQNMGQDRITAILKAGKDLGVFSGFDLRKQAKQIQIIIAGALIIATTENLYTDLKLFRKNTVELATHVARQ